MYENKSLRSSNFKAANLNGIYYNNQKFDKLENKLKYDNGILWATWKSRWYSFKKTEMWVRFRSKTIRVNLKIVK